MSSTEHCPTLDPSPPQHRTIFAVDIEGSTTRNNSAKAVLRDYMYQMVEASLRASGITEDHRAPLVDRGDGILTLIRPADDVPKTLVLTRVLPTLRDLLAEHERIRPEQRLRLRAVVHAGEVHTDIRGHFGEALDVAFRLLDAPEVKQGFKRSASPLYLVVSDLIYDTIVRQGYPGIDEAEFSEVVDVVVGKKRYHGWAWPRDDAGRGQLVSLVPEQARRAATRRLLHPSGRFGDRRHVVAP